MTESLVQQAKRAGIAKSVAFNTVDVLIFGDGGLLCHVSEDFNACSGAIIVSASASIYGHFAPHPDKDYGQLNAGEHHIQQKADEMKEAFEENKVHFPSHQTFVICTHYQGVLALPAHQKILENTLGNLGVPSTNILYLTKPRDITDPPGKGTAIVDSRQRTSKGFPKVFVEERLVSPDEPYIQPLPHSVSSSSQATTSYNQQTYGSSSTQAPTGYSQQTYDSEKKMWKRYNYTEKAWEYHENGVWKSFDEQMKMWKRNNNGRWEYYDNIWSMWKTFDHDQKTWRFYDETHHKWRYMQGNAWVWL